MEFITQETTDNLDLIRKVLADSGFARLQNITRLQSGSRSVAYFADDYIVRFPKAEIIWQTIEREKSIIDDVYPYLIPYFEGKINKISLINGVCPFSISKRLYGKICDGRPENEYAVLYQNVKPTRQLKLAQDLAMFFHLMHKIDYNMLNIQAPTEAIDNWDITKRENFDYTSGREALLSYARFVMIESTSTSALALSANIPTAQIADVVSNAFLMFSFIIRFLS